MAVESFKELENGFVGLLAEQLADDFHGKYFAVSQLRQWPSFSQGPFWKGFFHKIVYFAEDLYDKIIEVHFLPSVTDGITIVL